ncbi:aminotransferase class V-fold PLP-dependent enzyme [Geodermatophilus sabuli]|uniref:Aminotransferase class V-fold PLP-dependent enzyme n=1 Tax=Geodermatophilus sabuli TaxID=1564158 RepID=A0A7K3VZD1_9ACTN|nr:aminotransferase class V-fold PLP-dependent enzyme [Geodermatophilus sabuli]NEK57740.1 aminotransferase class V-fold PLP-dependent enzyme [Geodermatophilus sabuli]
MDEQLARARADFPYRDGRVYLQSAGVGLPVPGAVAAAGQYYVDVAGLGVDAQQLWHRPATRARERMARLLEVPVGDVGFFRNTSEVLNLAAHSVAWHAGDEVVVAADDYPGVVLPWGPAEAGGGRVVRVDPGQPHQREQRLLEALSPRTRVLAVSHVHPWTGTKLDLTRLGRACREVDCLLVVDGIQALGATPVDLSWVDVYGAGVFKWLLSGFGTSVGVFRERARELLTPAYRSYANPPPSTSFEYSAANLPGLYVLDASTAYLEELGWARVFAQVDSLAGEVADALSRLGIAPVTPAARAGIVTFDVEDSTAFVAALTARGVDVSDKVGQVIVSPHFYNTAEDVDRFAAAVGEVLG